MKVTVKLAGLITGHLPAGSSGNQAEIEIAEGATVSALMAQLGLPGEGSYLVIVDDETVPKARRGTHSLTDGASVAIVPPLKGG